MRIEKTGLSRGVLAGALLLALSCLQVGAQTPAAQSGADQKNRVAARVTETVDDTNRMVLRENVRPQARAEFDTGVVADAQPAKNSPNYHAWLTPDEFGKKFGPADADVQVVTDWLTLHGFQVSKVSKGRTVIEFSGNVGQVRSAFGTEIHKYNVKGEEHFANVK